MKNGTIVYCDDVKLNPDLIGTIKQSTSDYQKETLHMTLTDAREVTQGRIPKRTNWWLSSVAALDDDQLSNRFVQSDIDDDAKQDSAVLEYQKKQAVLGYTRKEDEEITCICRCIFNILDMEEYTVAIPYADEIKWKDEHNRRNFLKFLDIIKAVTVFNKFQRTTINGMLVAEYEDYVRGLAIYSGTAKNNSTNLTKNDRMILDYIVKQEGATIKYLVAKFNKSDSTIRKALHGEDNKSGMLLKVKGLTCERQTIENTKTCGSSQRNYYTFQCNTDHFEEFNSVAYVDEKIAREKINEYMNSSIEDNSLRLDPFSEVESFLKSNSLSI
jgi:hypothetical protein